MSDTLQKREDRMDTERINQIESKNADWCDDCHGYTHMPWCLLYKEPTPDIECQFCDFKGTLAEGAEHRKATQHLIRTVAVGGLRRSQSLSEHQPAARGEGDGDKWSMKIHGNEIDADLLVNGSYVGTLHTDRAKQVLTEHNQHQSLVADRERLERMLAAVINAHYGLAYRSIGSGDGIPEKEAAEIGRWWLDYTASDA